MRLQQLHSLAVESKSQEMLNIDDTIVALATAPGPGARAIVRLSGPRAWNAGAMMFDDERPGERVLLRVSLRLDGLSSPLPADVYFWPAPHSYTGQDVVELHVMSSPPLVELLVAASLKSGARAAQPGEFTMRAFLAGKLDLPRAEAVLGIIEARDRDELQHALSQLAGGLAQPLRVLSDDLLNLLADVEAGLDFSDEDLSFIDSDQMLHRLARGLAHVTLVRKQIEQRSSAYRPFRVVLAGPPNAGKSSLFNALTGRSALVSSEPGTTRDFLRAPLPDCQIPIELIDTAGMREPTSAIEAAAQALGSQQAGEADLMLWCEPVGGPSGPAPGGSIRVATKCDLQEAGNGVLATSALSAAGLPELRNLLIERAGAQAGPPLAPSLSRCRHHVDACLAHLRRAHAAALESDPPEILAMELRGALDELGAMVGAVYTDDLLDRIFSRFCIGK